MTQPYITYMTRSTPGLAALDNFSTPGPTHYQSKSQGRMAIKDMHDAHLDAAIAKLATAPGTSTTLAALRAEKARRT